MPDNVTTCEVLISNRQGLHARPAHAFVAMARNFEARIEVQKDDRIVDGKSILNILTLGAGQGSRLQIHATGSDATEALSALTQLVEQGFKELDAEEETPTASSPGGESGGAANASD